MHPQPQLEIRPEDLYTIVGELEVVRRSLNLQVQKYLIQIDEMSAEITRLREENGRLVQTDNHE
jgi:hypothetical protein